jgi:hypothetical protein
MSIWSPGAREERWKGRSICTGDRSLLPGDAAAFLAERLDSLPDVEVQSKP